MADIKKKHPQNTTGSFYVDTTCIDCDTCRWMAPEVFDRKDEQSVVVAQPVHEAGQRKAVQALLSCPTASIGMVDKPDWFRTVKDDFPVPVAENVYHCGYHHKNSFGATSYFIQRKAGNILVDSPRFTKPLVDRIEHLGGVKHLFLTHKDDVSDHAKWARHFGCDRFIHKADLQKGTADMEHHIAGEAPVSMADDLLMVPVPGHTRGSMVLLYQDQFLFTGDHLAFSHRLGHLYAFRSACWYDWGHLIRSMEKLLDYTFSWVLPGHGRRFYAEPSQMKEELATCIAWMQANPA